MSNDKPAPPKPALTVVGVRFVHPVKLGGNEQGSWISTRTVGWRVESHPSGMVFTPIDAKAGAHEVVVPWGNVISWERGAAS